MATPPKTRLQHLVEQISKSGSSTLPNWRTRHLHPHIYILIQIRLHCLSHSIWVFHKLLNTVITSYHSSVTYASNQDEMFIFSSIHLTFSFGNPNLHLHLEAICNWADRACFPSPPPTALPSYPHSHRNQQTPSPSNGPHLVRLLDLDLRSFIEITYKLSNMFKNFPQRLAAF